MTERRCWTSLAPFKRLIVVVAQAAERGIVPSKGEGKDPLRPRTPLSLRSEMTKRLTESVQIRPSWYVLGIMHWGREDRNKYQVMSIIINQSSKRRSFSDPKEGEWKHQIDSNLALP